nr:MAG: ORF1 [TTV-like mini virus]
MPPYWITYRRRRRRPFRRRFWFPRRRIRKTFHRRRWTRKYRRTNRKVKTKKFYKKKKTISLTVFQPKSIKLCKIKGHKCLFQGSPLRSSHNYVQYIYSYVPEHEPGGGGWSLMVFSLDSLFEDYEHLENVWTSSNVALPLVRYLGCTIRLYQSQATDYVFLYDNCWPMVDTPYTHADSCPIRMLMRKNKIIVPSRLTQNRKKPYKKVRIRPPAQMTNNWYFQHDIHKLPLLMTTTTAVSLTNPFANPKAKSNNISLLCLNPYLFQNPNFQHFQELEGYYAKEIGTQKVFLYASLQDIPHNITKQFIGQLIFLGNTKENQPGDTISNNENSYTKIKWGNPFYHRYLERSTETSYKIIFTTSNITTVLNQYKNNTTINIQFTSITPPIFYTVRYNPQKDTGKTNKIYLTSTQDDNKFNEPKDKNLIFDGFPLYILLWGWTDFIKKLKTTVNIDNNYILTIKTEEFDETLPRYTVVDLDFIEGFDPYQQHTEDSYQTNNYNRNNWFPKLQFQQQSIEHICISGPACPRPINDYYLQAYCRYTFYFKWGGCPKQLEKVYDPSLQSKWPTADKVSTRLEIQNPSTAPQTELYSWDWSRDYVKKSAIQRIAMYTETDEKIFSPTESKANVQALKTQEKEQPQTKEEKKLLKQLKLLQHQRLLLELQYKFQQRQLKLKE